MVSYKNSSFRHVNGGLNWAEGPVDPRRQSMRTKGIVIAALVLLSAVPALAVQRTPLIEYFTNSG